MNAYNISVTVGATIFRPQVNLEKDSLNYAIYYELLQRMIHSNKILFDKSITVEALKTEYQIRNLDSDSDSDSVLDSEPDQDPDQIPYDKE